MKKYILASLLLSCLAFLSACSQYSSINEIYSEEVRQKALDERALSAASREATLQRYESQMNVDPNTCTHRPRRDMKIGDVMYFPVDGGHQYQCSLCHSFYGEIGAHEYKPFETIKWTFVHDDARVTLVGSFCKQCGLCREYRMKTCMHEGYRWVVNPIVGKYQKMCSKCGMSVGPLYDALPEGAELYRYPSAETEAATGGES